MVRWLSPCGGLLLALLLAACGPDGPHVTSGEVVNRVYDDPDTYCAIYGQYGCQMWANDGPHWKLRLACNGEESWVEVAAADYERFPVGSQFPREEPCQVDEP
jgi:hypothetical protein